jgi:hypothetical protein
MASRPTPTNIAPVDFGPNVLIFDSDTPQAQITSKLSAAYLAASQNSSEMGICRLAIFFKPGSNGITYNLTVDVGYYMTIHGLGMNPSDVTIVGSVQSLTSGPYGLALDNFWRGAENLVIESLTNIWAVSQATYLRRIRIQGGDLPLCDPRYYYTNHNWSSGGFVADCVVDGVVDAGTQQQFLTRNCTINRYEDISAFLNSDHLLIPRSHAGGPVALGTWFSLATRQFLNLARGPALPILLLLRHQ